MQMAPRINDVEKLLTVVDGVQQPNTQPVEGSEHRLMEEDKGCKPARTLTLNLCMRTEMPWS